MKTVTFILVLFLHLLPFYSQAQPPVFCPDCDADFTINQVDCSVQFFPCFTEGKHFWTIAPLNMVVEGVFPNITLGPGTFTITHRVECPDGQTVKKSYENITFACEDCPPSFDDLTFNFEPEQTPGTCTYSFSPQYSGIAGYQNFEWTFENGTPATSTSNSPTVVFPIGTATAKVCLTMKLLGAEDCPLEHCKNIRLNCADPCEGFTAALATSLEDCTITLDGGASTGGADLPINFYSYSINGTTPFGLWGFGPPNFPRTYTFSQNGIYEVCLSVSNTNFVELFCNDRICTTVLVTDCAEGCINEDIRPGILVLSDNKTTGPCGYKEFVVLPSGIVPNECAPYTYYVDYGDGTFCNFTAGECEPGSTSGLTSHTYDKNGIYQACVYAFDKCGCYNFACESFIINCFDEPPSDCNAKFKLDCPGVPGEFVCDVGGDLSNICTSCFMDISTPSAGATIVEWKWTFTNLDNGDDLGSHDNNYVRACWNPENHVELCLEITDSEGCVDKYCEDYTSCFNFAPDGDVIQKSLWSNPYDFTIAPNPSNGHFRISGKDANTEFQKVEIYDLNGRLLWQRDTNGASDILIDQLDLPSGTYLLKATLPQSILSKKLVLLH